MVRPVAISMGVIPAVQQRLSTAGVDIRSVIGSDIKPLNDRLIPARVRAPGHGSGGLLFAGSITRGITPRTQP